MPFSGRSVNSKAVELLFLVSSSSEPTFTDLLTVFFAPEFAELRPCMKKLLVQNEKLRAKVSSYILYNICADNDNYQIPKSVESKLTRQLLQLLSKEQVREMFNNLYFGQIYFRVSCRKFGDLTAIVETHRLDSLVMQLPREFKLIALQIRSHHFKCLAIEYFREGVTQLQFQSLAMES